MTLRAATVVGLGLIGGSVLQALARAGLRPRGYDADPAARNAARRAGDGWLIADTLDSAVHDADLVLLAVPYPALPAVLDGLAGHHALVSDTTSVKDPVRRLAARSLPNGRFVGGHPMAGRERAGFEAGDATLFQDRPWVLCLDPETPLADWLAVAALLTGIGARVVPATSAEHDEAVARVSHLPNLTAAALAAGVHGPLSQALGAGSFSDGTRVAARPPELSAAICGGNPRALRDALDALLADLGRARALLDTDDPVGALTEWFRRGHAVRAAWPPAAGRRSTMRPEPGALLALGRAGGWVSEVRPDSGGLTVTEPAVTEPAG